jgi:hypothetical protein
MTTSLAPQRRHDRPSHDRPTGQSAEPPEEPASDPSGPNITPGPLVTSRRDLRRRQTDTSVVARVLAVLATVLAALALGWMVGSFANGSAPGVPQSNEIEAEWGVRFTSVTLTADGGLVDLRFVVLDPEKASLLLGDEEEAPRLAVREDGEVVLHPAMILHRGLQTGHTYVLLYRNTGGVVRVGHDVSILAGDERIDGARPS